MISDSVGLTGGRVTNRQQNHDMGDRQLDSLEHTLFIRAIWIAPQLVCIPIVDNTTASSGPQFDFPCGCAGQMT
jgi:hypothetical protein